MVEKAAFPVRRCPKMTARTSMLLHFVTFCICLVANAAAGSCRASEERPAIRTEAEIDAAIALLESEKARPRVSPGSGVKPCRIREIADGQPPSR
jgi:hypothetical protein